MPLAALLSHDRAERLGLPDREGPPCEVGRRKRVAFGRVQNIAANLEIGPGIAGEVTAAGKHAKQLERCVRDASSASLPVLDRAHANVQKLRAGEVRQPKLRTVLTEASGTVQAKKKLPVPGLSGGIFDFA